MNLGSNERILAFDVDDTLAVSGQPLTPEVCNILDELANLQGYQLAFITSRSYAELEKRVPQDILYQAYAFTCMGMEHWYKGDMVYQHYFSWPEGLQKTLQNIVDTCPFPEKTGNHLVRRPSKGALSVVGEGQTSEQRAAFIQWNKKSHFLQKATEALRQKFPELHIEAFGKTSIDFSDKRMSKAIVLEELRQFESRAVVFFGDNMQDGGNDCELKDALLAENKHNICVWVHDPAQTKLMLEDILNAPQKTLSFL